MVCKCIHWAVQYKNSCVHCDCLTNFDSFKLLIVWTLYVWKLSTYFFLSISFLLLFNWISSLKLEQSLTGNWDTRIYTILFIAYEKEELVRCRPFLRSHFKKVTCSSLSSGKQTSKQKNNKKNYYSSLSVNNYSSLCFTHCPEL